MSQPQPSHATVDTTPHRPADPQNAKLQSDPKQNADPAKTPDPAKNSEAETNGGAEKNAEVQKNSKWKLTPEIMQFLRGTDGIPSAPPYTGPPTRPAASSS